MKRDENISQRFQKHYLDEAIDQLQHLHTDDFFQFLGYKFVHVHDKKNVIRLTTLSNINLLTESTEFFEYGTFDYAPVFFLQYSI